MGKTDTIGFKTELAAKAERIDEVLAELLAGQTDIPDELKRAIDYTLKAPGKRLRAAIVLWCCEAVCGRILPEAEIAAAAIEMVHTYSLVHDDLPAMDDDDFRRGQPSCHKAFSEAIAILTGDALLTMAFEILTQKIEDAEMSNRLIATLAVAAGPGGMIAGQAADLQAENSHGSAEEIDYIHINKTAKMFQAAAVTGAIAGAGSDEEFAALEEFGLKLGLGFQIADDILDVCATSEQLGKTAGKDAACGKLTYPVVFGVERSKDRAKAVAAEAVSALELFGERAEILRKLTFVLLERTR